VGSEIERARVLRREDDRLGTNGRVVGTRGSDGRDVLRLPGAPVVAGDLPAVPHAGVEGIGHAVAVFLAAGRMPFAEGDPAVLAAARDAGGAALLLAAAEPVRERRVGRDVEHLRGR